MHGLFSEPRFDWYAVTFKDSVEPDYLVRQALKHWNSSSVELVRPRLPQYQQGIEINLGDRVIFHLCWGGCNSDPHLISKGFSAHEVYEWLIKLDYAYSVSRVDVCTDTVVPNMFDVLTKHQLAFSTARHIHPEPAGDWFTPGSPLGRTLYLGSRKKGSQAHTRTYEKGKQLDANPNWVRFEVEIKPQSADAKRSLAFLEPWPVMMSVKWVQALVLDMFQLSDMKDAQFQSISSTWAISDEQKAYLSLIRQYGNRLKQDAEKLPNGWSDVGLKIKAFMELAEHHKRALGGIGTKNPYDSASGF
jgi:hypothetical protein